MIGRLWSRKPLLYLPELRGRCKGLQQSRIRSPSRIDVTRRRGPLSERAGYDVIRQMSAQSRRGLKRLSICIAMTSMPAARARRSSSCPSRQPRITRQPAPAKPTHNRNVCATSPIQRRPLLSCRTVRAMALRIVAGGSCTVDFVRRFAAHLFVFLAHNLHCGAGAARRKQEKIEGAQPNGAEFSQQDRPGRQLPGGLLDSETDGVRRVRAA